MSEAETPMLTMDAANEQAGFFARHRFLAGFAIAFGSAAASFAVLNGVLFAVQLGRVPLFTQINGVNVGFKTVAAAKAELEQYHTLRRLRVVIGAKTYSLSALDTGVAIDVDKSLEQAMQPRGWLRIPVVNIIANTTVQFGTYYSVDHAKLEQVLKEHVQEHNVPAVDAKMVIPASSDQEIAILPEQKGYTLGVSDVANKVVEAVTENNFDIEVEPRVEQPKVKTEDLKPLVAQARAILRTSSNELQAIIENFAKTHGGAYKVAVVELGGSSRSAFYGADDVVITASTFKVFAAYIALQKVEQGKLRMDTPTSYGTLKYCIEQMILVSDNNCAIAVSEKMGWREMHNIARAAGFSKTYLTSNTGNLYGTAKDQAQLLVRLHNGGLINQEHTAFLLDLMKRQVFRSGIPAGSGGSAVADKVGFIGSINNDMGIVYSPKATYAVSILTDGSSYAAVRDLSRQIYDFYQR